MVHERRRRPFSVIRGLFHGLLVVSGALLLTLAFFLILPFLQAISKPPVNDLSLQTVDTSNLPPPPPPPPEEEEEEEEEPEEEPPELLEEAPPLDLAQLELALNPGFGGGDYFAGDFGVSLRTGGSDEDEVDALFSLSDLDQKPRCVHQPAPSLNGKMKRRAPGTVYVIFIVDQRGKVVSPKIQRSSDPIFESAALAAVKQWKFEPGKRNGEAVRFRMRVPITFPRS